MMTRTAWPLPVRCQQLPNHHPLDEAEIQLPKAHIARLSCKQRRTEREGRLQVATALVYLHHHQLCDAFHLFRQATLEAGIQILESIVRAVGNEERLRNE